MPVRIKEIHLLNVSTISQTLLNLIKPFMKTDIVEMVSAEKYQPYKLELLRSGF